MTKITCKLMGPDALGDSESREGVLQQLRQQLAEDRQRGDAAKAELLERLHGLRGERQRHAEDVERTQQEIEELRRSTGETRVEVEAICGEEGGKLREVGG